MLVNHQWEVRLKETRAIYVLTEVSPIEEHSAAAHLPRGPLDILDRVEATQRGQMVPYQRDHRYGLRSSLHVSGGIRLAWGARHGHIRVPLADHCLKFGTHRSVAHLKSPIAKPAAEVRLIHPVTAVGCPTGTSDTQGISPGGCEGMV